MGFIGANRQQLDLLGYFLGDFVPQDTKCRFVFKLVAKLDLRKLYGQYSDQGADASNP